MLSMPSETETSASFSVSAMGCTSPRGTRQKRPTARIHGLGGITSRSNRRRRGTTRRGWRRCVNTLNKLSFHSFVVIGPLHLCSITNIKYRWYLLFDIYMLFPVLSLSTSVQLLFWHTLYMNIAKTKYDSIIVEF